MSFDRRLLIPILLLAVAAIGCAELPYEVAKVSGRVTLDGEPLGNASVRFHPQASASGGALVGPGSIGQTDADGYYELMTYKGEDGAVVGSHKVSVSTYAGELVDPDNSDEVRVVSEERIPMRYRGRSVLTFEVLASQSNTADFKLTSQ